MTPTTTNKTIMPAFVFMRRRDIELEAGFILAGNLMVDIAKTKKLKDRQRRRIVHTVQQLMEQLTYMAISGSLPDDATVYSWPNGCRPPNADATVDDEKLMAAWAKDRLTMVIRVDPREGEGIPLDSDVLKQMGLPQYNQ